MNNTDRIIAAESTEVPGLLYVPNYIDQVEHDYLIATIDSQSWLHDLKRRVQHYGYKYDYKKRKIDSSMWLGNLPKWGSVLAERIYQDKFASNKADQLIINEYWPGQGIASHVDCISCFDNTIASLSLCSSCLLDFISVDNSRKISLLIEPRSLLIIKDEARYKWRHGIASRKTDSVLGKKCHRSRRISLTFRKVLLK